jgi:alkanesulfonate monooxygenase SsuD/methylene tetrahydromethanopterin reductase-like flavin-dependent oxidoreductase (luciferase family)
VVVGGRSERAFLRAARHADGWYGFLIGLRAMAEYREGLRAAIERTGRTEPLHISVSPSRRMDAETVRAYAELGVQRLILAPPPDLPLEDLIAFVEANAPERIGAAPV